MNSRFKFRVWNNKHNRYIVDSHYPIGSDHIIVIKQDGKAYNLGLGDYEDYSNMRSWAVMEEFTDCILEQCTGLKDKNGNLIYEGDIVYDSVYENNFVVSWDNDRTGYILSENNTNHIDYLSKILIERHKLKIIGNIHKQA